MKKSAYYGLAGILGIGLVAGQLMRRKRKGEGSLEQASRKIVQRSQHRFDRGATLAEQTQNPIEESDAEVIRHTIYIGELR